MAAAEISSRGAASPHGARPRLPPFNAPMATAPGRIAIGLSLDRTSRNLARVRTLSLRLTRGASSMTRRLWAGAAGAARRLRRQGARTTSTVVPPGAPVEQIEMDPIKITAVKGPDGTHLETYDVDGAVRAGRRGAVGEALRRRHRATTTGCSRSSPTRRYTKAALYNAGLAYQGKKDWQTRHRPVPEAGRPSYAGQLGRQGRPVPDRRLLRRAGQLADLGRRCSPRSSSART